MGAGAGRRERAAGGAHEGAHHVWRSGAVDVHVEPDGRHGLRNMLRGSPKTRFTPW